MRTDKKNTRVSKNIKPTKGSFTKELSQMKQNKSERIITKRFHPLISTDKMRPDTGILLSSKDFIPSPPKQSKHPSLSQKSPFVLKGCMEKELLNHLIVSSVPVNSNINTSKGKITPNKPWKIILQSTWSRWCSSATNNTNSNSSKLPYVGKDQKPSYQWTNNLKGEIHDDRVWN